MTHADLQETIPDYLAGRLADAARQALLQHVEGCDECADLVENWTPIVRELRMHGAAIFQAHPEPARLRAIAQRADSEDRDAAAHVASCPSCALEVDAWGSAAVREFGRNASARRAGRGPARAWWGIAAALAITALLAFAWKGTRLALPPEAASEWSGAPRMLILDGGERSGATHPRLDLEPGQPYAVLGAQFVLPVSADDDRMIRLSLLDQGGTEAWGIELRASEIRRRLRSEGAVMLMIPRHVLPAGSASLQAALEGERFWEVVFDTGPKR